MPSACDLIGDVDEVRAGSLREHGRRLADIAEVDGADIQSFQQLRPRRKLGPFDGDAQRREPFFERTVRLQQHERIGGFLITDAEFLGVRLGGKSGRGDDGQRGGSERCAHAGNERAAREQRMT
jgi:hypothetical protein